eukprot:1412870-Pyramimonas_sp.AAC.1
MPPWACGGQGGRMRTQPLGPSVELPMGPPTVSKLCRTSRAWVGRAHADTATGAFGGVPYAAAKR